MFLYSTLTLPISLQLLYRIEKNIFQDLILPDLKIICVRKFLVKQINKLTDINSILNFEVP